jgi:hypothetical protein
MHLFVFQLTQNPYIQDVINAVHKLAMVLAAGTYVVANSKSAH